MTAHRHHEHEKPTHHVSLEEQQHVARATNASPMIGSSCLDDVMVQEVPKEGNLEATDAETIGKLALGTTVAPESAPLDSSAPPKTGTRRKRKPDGKKSKEKLAQGPTPKGGKGHFKKQLRNQLAQSGKLNASEPMAPEQRRLRRRKRKR